METNAVLADSRHGEFRFDEAAHEYWLDQLQLPGLTGILKAEGFIDTTWYKPEHTARGTWVHKATHALDDNDLNWDAVPDDRMGFLTAWQGFKKEWNFRPTQSEVPGYHRTLLFATIPDAEGLTDHPEGLWKDQETLVEKKSGVVPYWCKIQTMAQKMMRESQFGVPLNRKRVAVRLTSWGSFMAQVHTEDAVDTQVFLSALTCYRWKQLNGGSKNGYRDDLAACD